MPVSCVRIDVRSVRTCEAYLSRLLLKGGKFLDSSLKVGLCTAVISKNVLWFQRLASIATLASSSASGSCLSTSVEKSLSGLRTASPDIFASSNLHRREDVDSAFQR